MNTSQALAAGESIGTAYSGYVHAASENIMDMYGGDPPHFHLTGMRGTPRISAFARDAENYIYRGLMATIATAKAFGDGPLNDELYKFLGAYESANGHSQWMKENDKCEHEEEGRVPRESAAFHCRRCHASPSVALGDRR